MQTSAAPSCVGTSTSSSRSYAPRLTTAAHHRATRVMLVRAAPEARQPPAVEPSRHMALPNNAMWLLDFLQDKFYDVRGPNFVIQRAESEDNGSTTRKAPRKSGTLARQTGSAAASGSTSSSSRALSLINRVVHQHPGSIMLLEGAVVDISEWLEPTEQRPPSADITMTANTTCTGIVRVEQQQEEEQLQEEDVFYNDSTSPRRTKRVGFTCKCCGARTYSNVNPQVFHAGTLVAQCAKCERWHKLSDHFGLFHHLQGPILGGRPLVEVDDIPPSLRLRDDEEAELW